MSTEVSKLDKADFSPSKEFFISMLTRDIEFMDAILDLLDNCIDGLQRSRMNLTEDETNNYSNYTIKIDFNETYFSIEDNCGGISEPFAKIAFRLGRPKNTNHLYEGYKSIGLYGIGMKRAIFKMGRVISVKSKYEGEEPFDFEVKIPIDWFENNEWTIPLTNDISGLKSAGTKIKVEKLTNFSSSEFSKPKFKDDLKKYISTHYLVFVEKGLRIFVNDEIVEKTEIYFLYNKNNGFYPYFAEAKYKDINMKLIVGFYRNLPTDNEITSEIAGKISPVDEAGWTVVCNDRVVLYADRTILTGWGDAGVARFHSQFNSIAGVLILDSSKTELLPINTTKRGIDGNSYEYLMIKGLMRDGLKKFIKYTNTIKTDPDLKKRLTSTSKIAYNKVTDILPENDFSDGYMPFTHRKFFLEVKSKTPKNKKEVLTIKFDRHIKEIESISNFFQTEAKPSEIGEMCFDRVLKEAKSNE